MSVQVSVLFECFKGSSHISEYPLLDGSSISSNNTTDDWLFSFSAGPCVLLPDQFTDAVTDWSFIFPRVFATDWTKLEFTVGDRVGARNKHVGPGVVTKQWFSKSYYAYDHRGYSKYFRRYEPIAVKHFNSRILHCYVSIDQPRGGTLKTLSLKKGHGVYTSLRTPVITAVLKLWFAYTASGVLDVF